ncbi:MAG: hypothetical protein WCP00_00190 [bacterium]|jgi:hypothetical protein
MKLLDKTITRFLVTLVTFGLAYGFYSLSVDRGSLWLYLLTLVFVYLGFSNLFKVLNKTLWKKKKN